MFTVAENVVPLVLLLQYKNDIYFGFSHYFLIFNLQPVLDSVYTKCQFSCEAQFLCTVDDFSFLKASLKMHLNKSEMFLLAFLGGTQ